MENKMFCFDKNLTKVATNMRSFIKRFSVTLRNFWGGKSPRRLNFPIKKNSMAKIYPM